MSTSVCWELTCDGLAIVSRPGGVKDSHPLITTEIGDKRRLYGPHEILKNGKLIYGFTKYVVTKSILQVYRIFLINFKICYTIFIF